jgi:hypothetical protein
MRDHPKWIWTGLLVALLPLVGCSGGDGRGDGGVAAPPNVAVPSPGPTAPGAGAAATTGAPAQTGGPTATGAPSRAPTASRAPAASASPGRKLSSVAVFDRNPCAVATPAEIGAAIARPYALVAANVLAPAAPPSVDVGAERRPGTIGCGFPFVAANDTSEAYHAVTVRVSRLDRGGPTLMSRCRAAAAAEPGRFRLMKLGDEACLGPDSVLPVRVGKRYYSFAVTAEPGRADASVDDILRGNLAIATATLLVARLPK